MNRRLLAASLAATLPLALLPGIAAPQADLGIRFADGTAAARIGFRHNSGAFGKKYLPETMGSGLALFDYDNDGWLDLFFANETHWPGRGGPPTYCALYHNNRDGTFSDVTRRAGLAIEMSGIGVDRRRLRQRRVRGPLRDRDRRQPPVPQPSTTGASPTSRPGRAPRARAPSAPVRCSSTTTATGCWT